jgi:hypothetical protein
MMRKKGQVAPSLTWFFAFLIIFFIIIFFTGGTLIAAKAKSLPVISWMTGGKSKIGIENHANDELAIVRKFETFANSPVKIKDDVLKIKDLPNEGILTGLENEKASAFKNLGNLLIRNITAANPGIYRGIWVRVYGNEQILEAQEGNNKIYAVESGKCDPASQNAIMISVFSTPTKHIVLCTEYD